MSLISNASCMTERSEPLARLYFFKTLYAQNGVQRASEQVASFHAHLQAQGTHIILAYASTYFCLAKSCCSNCQVLRQYCSRTARKLAAKSMSRASPTAGECTWESQIAYRFSCVLTHSDIILSTQVLLKKSFMSKATTVETCPHCAVTNIIQVW